MHNRSREEIIASILEASTSPSKKTLVMFNSRLSYCQLAAYFPSLQEKGLISSDKGLWTITEKGREYIHAYRMISEIIESKPLVQVLR